MRSYDIFAQSSTPAVAGKTATLDLDTSRDTRFITITVQLVFTTTVAVITAVRNLGSPLAIFDRMRLSEAGIDTCVGDPRLFGFASDFLKGQAGTRTRLSSTAVGVYTLIERFILPFERLQSAVGLETRYKVKNPGNRFQLNFDVNATPEQRLATQGGATIAVTGIVITARQYTAESNDAAVPTFAPRWREQILNVGAANAQLRHELDNGSDYVRGITLLQETVTTGHVTDILNAGGVQLRDDRRIYVGETGQVPWLELCADQEFLSSGDVFASSGGGFLHIDLQDRGRLSNILAPNEIAGRLRFLFNALPSVAGAGASQIRTLLHVLTRDVPIQVTGRRVVADSILFPV